MSIQVDSASMPNVSAMQAAAANKASGDQVRSFIGMKSAERPKGKGVKEAPAGVRPDASADGVAKQQPASTNGKPQQTGGDQKEAGLRILREGREASSDTRLKFVSAEANERWRILEEVQDSLQAAQTKSDDRFALDLENVQEQVLESAIQKDQDEYIGELDMLALRRLLKRAESMKKPDKLQFYLELLRSMPTQMTELRGVLHSLVTGALPIFK